MSSELRVALRIQAHAGDSRREIAQLNRDLHKAGKEGAKTLTAEAGNAGTALTQAGREGAASYKIIRQAMRDAATEGNGVFRQGRLLRVLGRPSSLRRPQSQTRRCAPGE